MIDPYAIGLPVVRLLRRISAAMIFVAAWQAVVPPLFTPA